MGKGGGGSSQPPTQQVVSQQSLPAYAQPYYNQIMGQAQGLAANAYTPYPNQLVSPFMPPQNNAFNMVGNLPNSYNNELAQAARDFNYATDTGNLAQQYRANPITAGNVSPTVTNPTTVGTGLFTDPGVTQGYMNPYVKASLDPQLALLRQQTGIAQSALGQQAAQQGAFGGYRQGVQGALTQQASDLAAQQMIGSGFNTAFQQAGQLYGIDAARQLQAAQANQGVNLQSQMANQGVNLQAQQSNQQAGLQSAIASEQARQQAENIALQGGNLNLQAGQGQTWLGSTAQRAALGDIAANLQAGGLQQQQYQTGLNTAYQQFLNQLMWPYQQLGFETGIMSGVPTPMQAMTSQYQNPNPVSQTLGLGLGAAGLYGMMGGFA